MRIRTIKPEFWTNERMASLSEFTRLLALALINYADDEGYFNANVSLIRGALFPFGDESGRIRGSLGELSRLDYLRLSKGADGREYGWIVHFSDHQKVEKLKQSRIKGLASFPEASGTSRGNIGDESVLEQGSGNRDQGSSSCPKPDGSDEQKFVDWFLALLVETGAPAPVLTKSNREAWASAYEKMIRLDGRTKDQVKDVCRWARNDSFWRQNFLSPLKLREKKDGVMYFDAFLNRMAQGHSNGSAVNRAMSATLRV